MIDLLRNCLIGISLFASVCSAYADKRLDTASHFIVAYEDFKAVGLDRFLEHYPLEKSQKKFLRERWGKRKVEKSRVLYFEPTLYIDTPTESLRLELLLEKDADVLWNNKAWFYDTNKNFQDNYLRAESFFATTKVSFYETIFESIVPQLHANMFSGLGKMVATLFSPITGFFKKLRNSEKGSSFREESPADPLSSSRVHGGESPGAEATRRAFSGGHSEEQKFIASCAQRLSQSKSLRQARRSLRKSDRIDGQKLQCQEYFQAGEISRGQLWAMPQGRHPRYSFSQIAALIPEQGGASIFRHPEKASLTVAQTMAAAEKLLACQTRFRMAGGQGFKKFASSGGLEHIQEDSGWMTFSGSGPVDLGSMTGGRVTMRGVHLNVPDLIPFSELKSHLGGLGYGNDRGAIRASLQELVKAQQSRLQGRVKKAVASYLAQCGEFYASTQFEAKPVLRGSSPIRIHIEGGVDLRVKNHPLFGDTHPKLPFKTI